MSFRKWVERLRASGKLAEATKPLSSHLEAVAFIKALEPKPALFHVVGFEIPVAANVSASRGLIAEWIGENSPGGAEARCT